MGETGRSFQRVFIGVVLAAVLTVGASSLLMPRSSSAHTDLVQMALLPNLPLAASDVGANYSLQVSSPNGRGITMDLSSSSSSGVSVEFFPSHFSTNGGSKEVALTIRADNSLAPGFYTFNITSASSLGYSQQTFRVEVVKYLVVTEVLRPSFQPANLTVPVGSTVYWVRLNGGFGVYDDGTHDVNFRNGGPQSPDLVDQYGAWSYTFNQTGTFRYYCSFHAYMTGAINVAS